MHVTVPFVFSHIHRDTLLAAIAMFETEQAAAYRTLPLPASPDPQETPTKKQKMDSDFVPTPKTLSAAKLAKKTTELEKVRQRLLVASDELKAREEQVKSRESALAKASLDLKRSQTSLNNPTAVAAAAEATPKQRKQPAHKTGTKETPTAVASPTTYTPEYIMDHSVVDNIISVKVKWWKFPVSEATWELASATMEDEPPFNPRGKTKAERGGGLVAKYFWSKDLVLWKGADGQLTLLPSDSLPEEPAPAPVPAPAPALQATAPGAPQPGDTPTPAPEVTSTGASSGDTEEIL